MSSGLAPCLRDFDETDLDLIMSWIEDARSCRVWGGPNFRFPFSAETFVADGRFASVRSYLLQGPARAPLAFGQLYEKSARIHLARLIAEPGQRRRGHAVALVRALVAEGLRLIALEETSLYVYKYNSPAVSCYRKLGYREAQPPEEDPMIADCLFLVAKALDVLAA